MHTTTSTNNKRRWNSIFLVILLALLVAGGGSMISQQAPASPTVHLTSQQVSISANGGDTLSGFVTNLLTVPNAYADECDGIGPPSNLDCPVPPTATPTATPDPGD